MKLTSVRNLDFLHEEHAHACLLLKQGRGCRLKLPRTESGFPQPPQYMPQSMPSTQAPDKESRALVIRMLTELRKRIDEHNFIKELENE